MSRPVIGVVALVCVFSRECAFSLGGDLRPLTRTTLAWSFTPYTPSEPATGALIAERLRAPRFTQTSVAVRNSTAFSKLSI